MMLIPDVNVLIAASGRREPTEERIANWVEEAMNGPESLGLPDAVWGGFVRIVTNPRVFPIPAEIEQALDFVNTLFAGGAVAIHPGSDHRSIFDRLCRQSNVRGDRVPDAYLAALAIESGSTFVTMDRGFARYEGSRWHQPVAS